MNPRRSAERCADDRFIPPEKRAMERMGNADREKGKVGSLRERPVRVDRAPLFHSRFGDQEGGSPRGSGGQKSLHGLRVRLEPQQSPNLARVKPARRTQAGREARAPSPVFFRRSAPIPPFHNHDDLREPDPSASTEPEGTGMAEGYQVFPRNEDFGAEGGIPDDDAQCRTAFAVAEAMPLDGRILEDRGGKPPAVLVHDRAAGSPAPGIRHDAVESRELDREGPLFGANVADAQAPERTGRQRLHGHPERALEAAAFPHEAKLIAPGRGMRHLEGDPRIRRIFVERKRRGGRS